MYLCTSSHSHLLLLLLLSPLLHFLLVLPLLVLSYQACLNCTSLLSHTSSSMTVRHGPCLLTEEKKKVPDFRNQMLEEASPRLLLGAQDQWLGAEQDQLSSRSTRTSSGNCQRHRNLHGSSMSLAGTASLHLEGWATPWSAEEMLDGKKQQQQQRVDFPAHARTAHNDLLQKTLETILYRLVCHVPPTN